MIVWCSWHTVYMVDRRVKIAMYLILNCKNTSLVIQRKRNSQKCWNGLQNAGKYGIQCMESQQALCRGLLYQADFPSAARSWPHHKSPETEQKNPTQFQFHLTHITPLPGITGLAPLTAFSWPAVKFVCVTFPLEFSPHLSGIQRPFLSFFFFYGLCHHTCYFLHPVELLADYVGKNNSIISCGAASVLLKRKIYLSLKCRNWFLNSTISRRCLSTATATTWEWGRAGPWFGTWTCQPGPRSLKILFGSTGW